MRFILFILLFVLAFQGSVHAQAKPFQNKIGYFEYDATPWLQTVDSSGNHYVLGQFGGVVTMAEMSVESKGDKDIYLIKYDSLNNLQWIRSYGSPAQDYARSISCDKDGNIYITGQYMGSPFYASSTITLNAITQYQQSRFLIKVNSAGVTQWAKRFSATSAAADQKSEVINDHDGRLYLIHTNRANGALNSWNYNDSIIANPSNQYINVPRWVMARIDQSNGNIKWIDYIANPLIGTNIITILNVTRPVIDSKNNIVFAISHFGNHINPIYVFGQYAALNPNANNILVKIDSMGVVRKFRDLGASNTSKSDIVDLALTTNDEPVLINKKALINSDGIYRDYWTNNPFNYARIYDTSFTLTRIVKLGNQPIVSYTIDKENRLTTLNTIPQSPMGAINGYETFNPDSTLTRPANVPMKLNPMPFFVRYKSNFSVDTVFTDSNIIPYGGIGFISNSLMLSNKGDLFLQGSQGITNNTVLRYTKNFAPKNANYGKLRDLAEAIVSIGEDTAKSIYVSGMIHLRADFSTSTGTITYNSPVSRGADLFVAKYKSDNSLLWIRRIGTSSNESPTAFKVGKDGLYLVASTTSTENWQYDTTNTVFPGKVVVIKMDFNGNLVWTKELAASGANNVFVSSLQVMKSGKILLTGGLTGTATIAGQSVSSIGTRNNLLLAILDNTSGQLVAKNTYALSNEALGVVSSFSTSCHEDNKGGIYLGITTAISNVNATNLATELYSARTNRIPFNQIWINQTGLIKVDSTLEIKKFKTFRGCSIGHIGGIDSTILFTAYARGSSFDYDTIGGIKNIPLHSYATNAHFVHFTGKIDSDLNIVDITKYDTTSIENLIDIQSRRIIPDYNRNEIYESVSFSNSVKLDSTDSQISAIGSKDILFLKYDQNGKLMGGQRLGTPQTDFFIAASASSFGLVFSTQTVNPQYQMQYLKMKNIYEIRQSIAQKPIIVNDGDVKVFSSNTTLEANPNILSPDTYISRNLSLNEIGRNPDTTIVKTGAVNLCGGESSYIVVNNATSISWKKDNVLISGQSGDSLAITSSGVYRAIIQTAEGRIDSTRALMINISNPGAPTVSNVSICETATTSALTATASTGNSLRWYGTSATGGTGSSTAPTPSSSTAGATNYYVSQVSAQGCESERAALVYTVNAKPVMPGISPISICIGAPITGLTATVGSGNSLRWYGTSATGGTSSATAPTPSSGTVGSTNYYVSQVSAKGCESDRAMLSYTVNALPIKPVISWNGTELSVTQSYASYQWLFNNSIVNAANAIQYKPVNPGSYRVLVKNAAGCADTSLNIDLSVTDLPDFTIPGNRMKVYPNPATQSTILDFGKKPAKPLVVTIVTTEGRAIKSFECKGQFSLIPLEGLHSGNYFIKIRDGIDLYTLKLIKL